jgi:hypothetical protein
MYSAPCLRSPANSYGYIDELLHITGNSILSPLNISELSLGANSGPSSDASSVAFSVVSSGVVSTAANFSAASPVGSN